ncbi:unnamed protein product [Clonostachys rosea f. rosea IK726]|uniref:Uncharacterized protein n=1 Tax=Clonostachys rosea f. rosea IK726 TaxID=1349383 RepID=A0ACA9TRQ2_BIOOC|nr:unnamed protein product [Clonostachys rosea f. rosea IK726]
MCRPGYGSILKRNTAGSNRERGISPAAMPGQSEAESPIPGLEVSLTQVKASSSPPVVTVTVTNRNSFPVTLLTYDSPTSSEIEFDDGVFLDPAQLAGAKVVVKGRWKAVWKMVKEDIGQASLDDPDGNPDAFQGEFQSDELELVV